MNVEAAHAKKVGVPVFVLCDPSYVDGPPARYPAFAELAKKTARPPVADVVAVHMRAMAANHELSYEQFLELSADRVIELEYFKPTPRIGVKNQDPLQGDPK